MSTVSTQPQTPKGFNIPKKMKRLIVFAVFFGLFMFSMSIFIRERINSQNNSDISVYSLAEEIRQLKENQEMNTKLIERLYRNQNQIANQQYELNQVREGLAQEISRVQNIAVKAFEVHRNVQEKLQQQDLTINSILKNKAYSQGYSQESLIQLQNIQRELENFRKVLVGFEAKINNNNKMVANDMRELQAWVSQNAVTRQEVNAALQSNPNTQKQLINELNNQKNLVSQVSQNGVKQANEIKEIARALNTLQDYTLDSLQKLTQQNANNERRINVVEKTKTPQGSVSNQGKDNSQLAVEFKNFKDYTMEALQELRAFNNKNTKRINHLQTKESENHMIPIGDMISQEIEKFFNSLGEGKLLEKILQETNISMEEVHNFVNIVKMLAEGDVHGVLRALNQLAGGNVVEQLMDIKRTLFGGDNKNGSSNGGLDNLFKYASMVNDLMGGNSEKESNKQNSRTNNNQKQQKAQKKREISFEDILNLLD